MLTEVLSSRKLCMYKIALHAPSIPTIQLLTYSIKTNEQELYIAKPQNEARSDTRLLEEGRSAVLSSY